MEAADPTRSSLDPKVATESAPHFTKGGRAVSTPRRRAARVQELIDRARETGASTCAIPDSLIPYEAATVRFDAAVAMIRQESPLRVFDVTAYGAVGDGATDDTSAIQAAVDGARFSERTAPVFLPEGTYAVRQVSIPLGVSVEGVSARRCVLRGIGSGSVVVGAEGWVEQSFARFRISHEGNETARDVPLMEQKFGARRCEFEDVTFVGVDGRSSHGLWLHGEHPQLGMVGLDSSATQGVFYNIFRNLRFRTMGGYLKSSDTAIAMYLQGTTTYGARANLNLLERCHVAGWGVGFRLDEGHDNVFLNCKQEDEGRDPSFPRHHLEIRSLGTDSVTHDNLVIGQSFDAANPGSRVLLHNEQIKNHPTAVTFIGCRMFDPTTDISFTSGLSTAEKPKYQAFGVVGGNRVSDRDWDKPAGSRTARLGGAFDDGVASFDGGVNQACGRFIAAGSSYAADVAAVSGRGGASISIRDDPAAEFRLVKTRDGLNYERVWAVGRDGIVDYRGNMGASRREPGRHPPDAWVEVRIEGDTYYLPAYRP